MSERAPLLQDRDSGQQFQQGEYQKGIGRALGPLEISRSTRYGILAGLWLATFLSVSFSGSLSPVRVTMMSITLIGSES